jgi:hypothetical protein
LRQSLDAGERGRDVLGASGDDHLVRRAVKPGVASALVTSVIEKDKGGLHVSREPAQPRPSGV